ncbi:MAG: cell wall-active antibiotics response protein LiaF [Candidatus Zixiibacteriota bacterium]
MTNKREFWGILILVVGIVLLLSNFHFIDYSIRHFLRNLWPLILVVIGIALIIHHARRRETGSNGSFQAPPGGNFGGSVSKTFGDIRVDLKDHEIDGFSTSTTFGDNTISLSGARLKSGINRLMVSGVFGDIVIIVPANMEVFAYGSTTFGDVTILGKTESGISNHLQNQTDDYDSATSKVHISAGTTFGDVKIYRA